MRIGIQGWGSEGDLRPLVALAARARREGHEVRLVLTPIDGRDYAPACAAHDVPLKLVPERMETSLQAIAEAAAHADPSKISRDLLDLAFFPFLDEMFRAAEELCGWSDVVVGHFSSWYVKAAALKHVTPFVAVHYFPYLVPSRQLSPPGLPAWPWLRRPGWWLLRKLINLGFRKPGAELFARHGLPPVRDAIDDLLLSDRLNLLAASPAFCPPAPDWAPVSQVCGQLEFGAESEAWTPSAELTAFLADGEKPVLMSLGSMEHLAPERARELLVGAAREAKVRAIVQTKNAGEEGRDGELYFLPWAPHQKLAPRCSAFVHHGGAGTSHAALRAGCPSVVVPFIFEQGMWGTRLRKAGTAPKPLSFWKAKPATLAMRVREVLETPQLGERARALSDAMRTEDGAGVAVRLLEALVEERASGTMPAWKSS